MRWSPSRVLADRCAEDGPRVRKVYLQGCKKSIQPSHLKLDRSLNSGQSRQLAQRDHRENGRTSERLHNRGTVQLVGDVLSPGQS